MVRQLRLSFLPYQPWLQRLLLGIAIITLGLLLGFWQRNLPESAPVVTFKTIVGEQLKLVELKGRPVIVTFWATDCASCVKEIPHLIELYQRYHAQGLEIVAVAMYYDLPNHVVEMTRQKQIPYRVALDLKADLARAFGNVQLTPTTFLIAPDGLVAAKIVGAFKLSDLQNQLAHYF
ncbi:MAG: TlpA family protein disulfide reductase [Methylococcaceae bacterium]|nr:TlpA family protein disulfide reductase [Methylococcaceae bacterium]